MRKDELEKLADKVLDWCAENFGSSKFYDGLPIVEVEYEGGKNVRGEYEGDNNLMTLYTRTNTSTKLAVMTILHEYKHYLQSPIWLERYSKIYTRQMQKNPYEIDAEHFALLHWRQCMNDLKLTEKSRGKHNK